MKLIISSSSACFRRKIFVLGFVLLFAFGNSFSVLAETQPFNPENLTAGLTEDRKGLMETDEASGAFTYNYPINIPPGRNGLQPIIKLNYNNQQANNYPNIIGHGWNIEIPYIDRINKTGTEKLYTDNYFYSTLSGELVLVSGNNYAPKVENGNFLKYQLSGNIWTVTDKKGMVYKFGNTAGARQDNPVDSTKVHKWMLEEVRDTNNNYVKYTYHKDAGQIYPDIIKYTGNNNTDGIFEVSFLRQSRTDVTKSYATAFLVTTNYRINEIQAKVNGAWVRKYTLAYTTGDNGVRSLLASITESGQDEVSNITSLPPTSFTYNTATPGWTLDTETYTSPTPFANGYQSMLDINGDALTDIVESYKNNCNPNHGIYKNTYINNNNGTWSLDNNMQAPILFRDCEIRGGAYQDQWDQGVRMGDVNGDMLPDILWSEDNENNRGGTGAYLNTNGTSWTQNSNWIPTVTFNGDDNIHTWGSHLTDLNGDGLPDVIRKQGGYFKSQLNSVNSFVTETTNWNPPSTELTGPKSQFVDFNGDSLPDVIYMIWNPSIPDYDRYVYINKGDNTWILDNSWIPPLNLIEDLNAYDKGLRFLDVNNDGLLDAVPQYSYIYNNGASTYLNTGTGWVQSTAWNVPSDTDISFTSDPVNIVDINSDGTLDFFTTQNSNPMVTKVWTNNTTSPVDVLKKVTFPQGSNTTITYKKTTKYVDGSNNLLNPKLPIPLDTVYQTTTVDSNGVTSTETFSYEGGTYYFHNALDRRLAGFAKVTKTDSAGNKTINYFHQGNTTNSAQGEYDDHVSKIGKIYRTEVADSSGNIYQKTINKWDKYNQGTGRDFVKLVRSTTETFDGNGTHKDKAEEYTYNNTYGNVTQKISWGEVLGADDGSFTDVGTDKFTEDISYVANTGNYVVGLPYQSTTVDQSANKVRESKMYYDTLALGSVGAGNNTKTENWKTGSTYINTQKVYNTTYGTVTSSTDERGKVTNYSYDSYNLYPATATNPLSQITSYSYDYSAGKPQQVTDVNNFVYQTVYDGLDRVLQEKVPDLTTPYTPVVKTQYTYTDTSGAVKVQKTDYLDASTSVDTYQYFDGLNRLVQERSEAETSGEFNVRDIIYNSVGQVLKESLKYTSTGSARTSATATTSLYNNYTYDAMGRVLAVSNSVGTTSNAYDDWKTVVTDPKGKVKNYFKDAYDNLVKVEEVNGASTYTTNYEWNGNKNLTKITDALGNIRNFTYDGLGRKLTAEDLHATADSTFGTWTYAYDDAGNMTQSISPEAKTVNYTYNDINQNLTEDYAGATGTEITNTYGGCANGVGKLCFVVTSGGVNTDYAYLANGLVDFEDKNIDAVSYDTYYTYNRQGNTVEIKYPDNSRVQYIYNTAGLLEKIQRKESGGNYTDVVANYDYNPMGAVTLQEDANGFSTTNTYDATKLYRLTRKLTALGMGGEEMNLSVDPEIPLEPEELNIETVEVKAETKVDKNPKFTDGFVKNVHDVKAWRRYHQERVEYMQSHDVPVSALQKAQYAQDQFEGFLIEKKYINKRHGEIRPVKRLMDSLKNSLEELVGMFLPEKLYAYAFGIEDFETCDVLPCSFSSSDVWGSVTSSLDHTSKVAGEDSLKNVVAGEGGSGLVKSGLSTSELWFKIKVYIPSPMNFGPSGYASIAVLEDSSTNKLVWLNIEDWGTTRVTVDGDTLPYTNTGLDLVQGAVNTIQMRVKMGTTNGDVDIWLNNDVEGSPDYNGSGTMNVGTNNVDRFQAGLVYSPENGVSTTYHDDVIVDSAFIGSAGGGPTIVQDLNYTYDNNGNILTVIDNSETNSAKTTTYTYDDLNRLLTSTITNSASGGNTTQIFTYDALGNITSSPEGTYLYDGASGTNYANPHAVTAIGDTNYTYDKNGNTLTKGTGLPWYSVGGTWTNRKQITIDRTKVSGGADLSNFPVLVNITDATLKTVANGGNVGKSNGTDILFTASDGVTKLSHEIEKYNATTGNLIAWVKVPTLAYATDTNLIIYYGNASASDQQDKVNVWDSNTKGVWHFNNSLNDSTSNANNATNYSSTNTTSGKVGDARDFTTTNSRVTMPNTASLKPTTALTVSMWVKRNGAQVTYAKPFWFGQTNNAPWGPYGIEMDGTSDTITAFKVSSDTTDHYTSASTTLTNTTWYYIAGTYDGTNIKYYINNNLQDTEPASITIGNYDTVNGLGIAADYNGYSKWKGWIDEVRVSSTARTQGWLTTEYNNQNSPSTFLTLGAVGGGSSTSYTWDYRNQLTSTSLGTSYTYDQSGQRMKVVAGGVTTTYPNKFYNISGTKQTKNIYSGETLIATIETVGTTITPYYVHTDHLSSTNATTNDSGELKELLDYYPYGSQRINEGTHDSQRQYIGQVYDETTNLNYLNARYYQNTAGRFMSEDPSHLAVGDTNQIKKITGQDLQKYLSDPQQLNSYSYAKGNPVIYKDADGKVAAMALPVLAPLGPAGVIIGGAIIGGATIYYGTQAILQSDNWGSRYGGQVPMLDPGKFGFGQPPTGPEDMIPNMRPDLPKWAKWITGSIIGSTVATEFYEKYQEVKQYISEIKNTTKKQENESLNSKNTSAGAPMNTSQNSNQSTKTEYIQNSNRTIISKPKQ